MTAKGIEDTAFYRYVRLLALNDVGGDPGRWGISVDEFHAANVERARRFPRNLLVTQTHDTKRSGDARARIGALSAMADGLGDARAALVRADRRARRRRGTGRPERYFIFQTLVGVWPITPERLEGYVEKALREAKRNTNWVDQNHDWEQRVKRYAVALLTHEPFVEDFEPFVAEVAAAGERSALGQLLLKLTVPGVPDVYQGDELIDLSLVDPDNRRPVDWDARRAALDALRAGARAVARDDEAAPHLARAANCARGVRRRSRGGGVRADRGGPGRRRVQPRRGADVVVVVPLRPAAAGAGRAAGRASSSTC